MAIHQIGNGYFNDAKGTYTTYDAATGQLYTRYLEVNAAKKMMLDPEYKKSVIVRLQAGQLDVNRWFEASTHGSGGRSNVNVQSQIGQAAAALRGQYPQMSVEASMGYASKFISDRVANGWDSNEVENMVKDITRGDNTFNNDFAQQLMGIVGAEERASLDPKSTGETDPNAGPKVDPRGSIQDELRAFAGRMMSVLPPDSPQVQRIAELAANAGNKYATQTGMGPGGITTTNVANTAARANVDLQTQREGIGAQALAAAGNQQLSVDALNTQLQQLNQQSANSQAGGIGGLIGSAAGLIGGGIATAYGANPQIIPSLMQGGGSYGTGIGTMVSNGNQGPIQYGGGQGAPRSSYKGKNGGIS